MQLQDRGVVVTGAARGIGEALATRLAAEGARLVVNDVDAEALAEVAARVGAVAVAGDAASEEGAAKIFDTSLSELGRIDVWCGNAGLERGRGLFDTSEDDWADLHEVNVMAHVRAARLLVPHWVDNGGGRYVMTASAAGLLTMLGSPAYSVTKHAALGFAEWLSATFRHQGVVVHAICPQGVRTRMLADSGPLQEVLSHDTALDPEDVAEALMQAMAEDRFLVLPHPEVGRYFQARAADTDAWLAGMNRLQQKVEAYDGVTPRE